MGRRGPHGPVQEVCNHYGKHALCLDERSKKTESLPHVKQALGQARQLKLIQMMSAEGNPPILAHRQYIAIFNQQALTIDEILN